MFIGSFGFLLSPWDINPHLKKKNIFFLVFIFFIHFFSSLPFLLFFFLFLFVFSQYTFIPNIVYSFCLDFFIYSFIYFYTLFFTHLPLAYSQLFASRELRTYKFIALIKLNYGIGYVQSL